MQKIEIAVNQQGLAQAYILGVYFGDGCITRNHFHLKTIDKDFADYFSEQFLIWKPDARIHRGIYQQHKTAKGKKPLHYVDVYHDVIKWIESATANKTELPSIAYAASIPFLEGFLDSDGWVNINVSEKTATIRLQIGVCKCGDYIYEMRKLFGDLGIVMQKMQTTRLDSGKVMKRIRFNPQSFLESGLKFHIARKQDRLDAYRKAVDVMGKKRVRANFNDYKGELLEIAKV